VKPIDRVLEQLENVSRSGDGFKARCPNPGHGIGRGDRNPSLGIKEGEDGRVLMTCFADCDINEVVEVMSLQMSDLFPAPMNGRKIADEAPSAVWETRDTEGVVQAEHVRFDRRDGKKDCYWRLPGARDYGLKGRKLESLPLYGSEHAARWPDDAPFVVVAEGEPATDALLAVHFPAVGTVTGASKTPGPHSLEVLRGRRVVLWPDNDEPGKEHMERVAAALQGIAAEVRLFEWSDGPEKGDAADHPAIRSGKKSEVSKLLAEMANARLWEPGDPETLSDHAIGSEFGQKGLLPLKSPKEIIDAAGDGTDWIVEGLVAPGEVTDLAGAAKKSGKTTFLTHMVAAVIGGSEFTGFATRKAKVLFLTEQGNNFANALRKSGLVDDQDTLRIVQYRDLDGKNYRWENLIAAATEVCKLEGFEVLVVDTFAGLSGLRGTEENNVGDILEKMAPLKVAAQKHGIAVVVARHAGKDGKGRGSSIFEGEADIVLTLGRPEGNHNQKIRVLEGIGRHDDIPARINIELTDKGYLSLGDDDKVAFNKAVEALKDVVPHDPDKAMAEEAILGDAAFEGISRTTARSALNWRMDQGDNPIKREGEGKKGKPYRYWQPPSQ
jgi:hypothetical protein